MLNTKHNGYNIPKKMNSSKNQSEPTKVQYHDRALGKYLADIFRKKKEENN